MSIDLAHSRLARRAGDRWIAACGNTMKSQNITLADLLPGFASADKGGVVRIAELQSQGYLYLRP
jgi:intracellular sulfur oxidation DsrE/DsrF family protein